MNLVGRDFEIVANFVTLDVLDLVHNVLYCGVVAHFEPLGSSDH